MSGHLSFPTDGLQFTPQEWSVENSEAPELHVGLHGKAWDDCVHLSSYLFINLMFDKFAKKKKREKKSPNNDGVLRVKFLKEKKKWI